MEPCNIIVHLGPKELNAAAVGLTNNFAGRIISLDEFKRSLPISFRNKNVVVSWLKQKGFLDSKIVENCGTIKKAEVVAWTKKAVALKKKHSEEIDKELKRLNEGYII